MRAMASQITGEFPVQKASYAENVSIGSSCYGEMLKISSDIWIVSEVTCTKQDAVNEHKHQPRIVWGA